MKIYSDNIKFDWDEFNSNKNLIKHFVSDSECEEVFFNFPLLVYEDIKHSFKETRFYTLGKSNNERYILIVFTIRNDKIRVISARDMNKKERMIYNEEIEKYT